MSIEKEARFGVWVYFTDDENRARWRCSECGKILHRHPYTNNKFYCSYCGAKMRLET